MLPTRPKRYRLLPPRDLELADAENGHNRLHAAVSLHLEDRDDLQGDKVRQGSNSDSPVAVLLTLHLGYEEVLHKGELRVIFITYFG